MDTATQSAQFASTFRDVLLYSLTQEVPITKQVLAAVPPDKAEYRPEAKARTAAELAWHIASIDVQFCEEIAEGKFSMDPRYKDPVPLAELPAWYEKNMNRAMEKLRAVPGEQLVRNIDFYGAFNLPGYQYLLFLNNHSIHHRGQLATYLRPMGSKVPSIYGGSADIPWEPAA
jgi:uncharacterized damage-inducible protein DinB